LRARTRRTRSSSTSTRWMPSKTNKMCGRTLARWTPSRSPSLLYLTKEMCGKLRQDVGLCSGAGGCHHRLGVCRALPWPSIRHRDTWLRWRAWCWRPAATAATAARYTSSSSGQAGWGQSTAGRSPAGRQSVLHESDGQSTGRVTVYNSQHVSRQEYPHQWLCLAAKMPP
jgi:hypothetical protein